MLQDSWLFLEQSEKIFKWVLMNMMMNMCSKSVKLQELHFIGSHPKGYDLEIRERISLSGGQKQTINLARSLYKPETHFWMNQQLNGSRHRAESDRAMREFCSNKTMPIVTYRNPILAMVDKFSAMENGNIISDQTPEQLGIKKVSK